MVIRGIYPFWQKGFNAFWEDLSFGAHNADTAVNAFIANCGGAPVMYDFKIRGNANLSSIRLTSMNNY